MLKQNVVKRPYGLIQFQNFVRLRVMMLANQGLEVPYSERMLEQRYPKLPRHVLRLLFLLSKPINHLVEV